MTTRREVLRFAAAGVGAVIAPQVRALVPVARAPGCAVPPLLQQLAERLLEQLPEVGVYNGVPGALNGGPLARRMDDWSPAGVARLREALGEAAQLLRRGDCAASEREALQLAVAGSIIADGNRTRAIHYGRPNPLWFSGHVPYVVSPVAGPHIDTLGTMMSQQSLANAAALDAWLEKLEGLGPGFDAVREKIAADEALGCRPPRVLLAKVLPILDAFLAGDAAGHPLIASLRTRTSAAALDPQLRAAAERRAVAALDARARPAFRRLREHIAAMVPRGEEQAGVWAQPEGGALYAANVRALGDTALTPQEIHRIGREEMRRASAQMDVLLKANGYSSGSVAARYRALAAEPRVRFADSDAGRLEALDFARRLLSGAEAKYPSILPRELYPRAQLEIRRVPPATEAGAPPAFCDPPGLDGQTPGVFWLNLRDMQAVTRMSLPTTAYHEGIPGHFTAGGVERLAGDQPLLLGIASFNAYNEGWALYAERLMAELGAYAQDPVGDLGRLNQELFRAIRLVVDTGLHELKWSREKAIAFASEASGQAASEISAEVERYMAWPGQALGYKLGQLRLLEMREGLRRRLGARFDLREFHRAVLASGSLPLEQIAKLVEAIG